MSRPVISSLYIDNVANIPAICTRILNQEAINPVDIWCFQGPPYTTALTPLTLGIGNTFPYNHYANHFFDHVEEWGDIFWNEQYLAPSYVIIFSKIPLTPRGFYFNPDYIPSFNLAPPGAYYQPKIQAISVTFTFGGQTMGLTNIHTVSPVTEADLAAQVPAVAAFARATVFPFGNYNYLVMFASHPRHDTLSGALPANHFYTTIQFAINNGYYPNPPWLPYGAQYYKDTWSISGAQTLLPSSPNLPYADSLIFRSAFTDTLSGSQVSRPDTLFGTTSNLRYPLQMK